MTRGEADGERIVLAHGGGGELTTRLIRERLVPVFGEDTSRPLDDGAVLDWGGGRLVFTTDTYVVTPLVFPGGDIGRLAVAGTVNDLAVMGAEPVALSVGMVLEEGLPLAMLDRAARSMAATAREAGVRIVTGDTKVIERRPQRDGGDEQGGMMINTTGVGCLRGDVRLGVERIEPGDAIVISGPIAAHGLAIMSLRNGLEFETPLRSDAAPLNGLLARVLASGADVKFARDATRGGVAGVLADIVDDCGLTVEVEEASIPVSPAARHAAELLGLDPLTVANEGVVVCVVAGADAERVVAAMRGDAHGREAVRIGSVCPREPAMVELLTRFGGRRVVQRPYGEELPRIC